MAGRSRTRRVPQHPATLLCIDDQAAYLPVRKAFLESQGYDVLTASSGLEGLRLLHEHRIDALVLDYHMPGMHGGDVASEISRIRPDLPIILLSGYPQDIPEAVRSQVKALVIKGQNPGVLLEAIRAAIPRAVLHQRMPGVDLRSSEQRRKLVKVSIQHAKKTVGRIRGAAEEHPGSAGRRRRK